MFVYKNLWDVSVGEELPCECSGNEKDPYVVAVMRIAKAKEAMYPGRYQLLIRYFWQISCLLAIGRSETEVL